MVSACLNSSCLCEPAEIHPCEEVEGTHLFYALIHYYVIICDNHNRLQYRK